MCIFPIKGLKGLAPTTSPISHQECWKRDSWWGQGGGAIHTGWELLEAEGRCKSALASRIPGTGLYLGLADIQWATGGNFKGHTKLPRSTLLLQNRVANSPEGRVCGVSEAIQGLTRVTEDERDLEIMVVKRQDP